MLTSVSNPYRHSLHGPAARMADTFTIMTTTIAAALHRVQLQNHHRPVTTTNANYHHHIHHQHQLYHYHSTTTTLLPHDDHDHHYRHHHYHHLRRYNNHHQYHHLSRNRRRSGSNNFSSTQKTLSATASNHHHRVHTATFTIVLPRTQNKRPHHHCVWIPNPCANNQPTLPNATIQAGINYSTDAATYHLYPRSQPMPLTILKHYSLDSSTSDGTVTIESAS